MDRVDQAGGSSLSEELNALRLEVRDLVRRVQLLEMGCVERPIASGSEAAATEAPPGAHHGWALGSLATACFALVGALLLRTSSHQGWIGAGLGIAFGVGYSALLLVVPPLVERWRGQWLPARTLQLCGACLAPLVVLESLHRSASLGPGAATGILATAMFAVALAAGLQRNQTLALVVLVELFALAAIGLTPAALVWRGMATIEAAALALWLAHRGGWPLVRTLTLSSCAGLLTLAVLLSTRRSALAAAAPWLVYEVVALAVLVAFNAVCRLRQLTTFEKLGPPLLASLACALGCFYSAAKTAPVAALIGAALLGLSLLLPVGREWSRAAASSAQLSAVVLLAGGLIVLDRSGLGLVAAALLLQRGARRQQLRSGAIVAQLLGLTGAALALVNGSWAAPNPRLWPWAPIALGSSVSLALLYLGALREGVIRGQLAPGQALRVEAGAALAAAAEADRNPHFSSGASLLGAVVMAMAGLQLVIFVLRPDPSATALVLTVLLGLAATLMLLIGKRLSLVVPLYLGAALLLSLIAKVLFWDIVKLEGAYVVGSVLSLGVAAGLSALIVKRPARPSTPAAPGATAPGATARGAAARGAAVQRSATKASGEQDSSENA